MNFIAVLFIIVPNWKQPECPTTGKWINHVVYPYNGVLLSKKTKCITDTDYNLMNLKNFMLSKRSQNHILYDSIHQKF